MNSPLIPIGALSTSTATYAGSPGASSIRGPHGTCTPHWAAGLDNFEVLDDVFAGDFDERELDDGDY